MTRCIYTARRCCWGYGWAVLKVWRLTVHVQRDATTTEASVGLGDDRTWGLRLTLTGHRWGKREG